MCSQVCSFFTVVYTVSFPLHSSLVDCKRRSKLAWQKNVNISGDGREPSSIPPVSSWTGTSPSHSQPELQQTPEDPAPQTWTTCQTQADFFSYSCIEENVHVCIAILLIWDKKKYLERWDWERNLHWGCTF